MKRLFLIVLVLWSAQLHAQSYDEGLSQATGKVAASIAGREGQIATVLDLNGLDGATTQLGKLVAQDVFDQLVGSAPSVRWIDLSQRDFIIQENQLAADRLMDPATQKQLGKLLGLSMVVTGTVTELGNNARIQIRAVEIETARVIASASTTVQLPEALKRLNDRRLVNAAGTASGSRDQKSLEADVLSLQANRIDVFQGEDVQYLQWSASLRIENVSGSDLWLMMTGFALGPCRYGELRLRGSVSGVEYARYVNPLLVRHEQRRPHYTPLPAGSSIIVSIQDQCQSEYLSAFSSGATTVVSEIAVDFVDRLERRSFSIPEATITSGGR